MFLKVESWENCLVVGYLPNRYEALGLRPCTEKKRDMVNFMCMSACITNSYSGVSAHM